MLENEFKIERMAEKIEKLTAERDELKKRIGELEAQVADVYRAKESNEQDLWERLRKLQAERDQLDANYQTLPDDAVEMRTAKDEIAQHDLWREDAYKREAAYRAQLETARSLLKSSLSDIEYKRSHTQTSLGRKNTADFMKRIRLFLAQLGTPDE